MEIYQDSMGHRISFRSVFSVNDRVVSCFIIMSGGKLPSQLMSTFCLIGFQRFRQVQHNALGANKPIGAELDVHTE